MGGLLDVQGGTGGQNELLLLFQFADYYSLPPTWCKTAAPSKWGRYFEVCILESGLCVLYLEFGYVSFYEDTNWAGGQTVNIKHDKFL